MLDKFELVHGISCLDWAIRTVHGNGVFRGKDNRPRVGVGFESHTSRARVSRRTYDRRLSVSRAFSGTTADRIQ